MAEADSNPYQDVPGTTDAGGGWGNDGGKYDGGQAAAAPALATQADLHFAEIGTELARKMGGWVSILFVASLSCVITAGIACSEVCAGVPAYGVAVGSVSLVLCCLFIALSKNGRMNEQTVRHFALFFFLWWAPAVGVLTFSGPQQFQITGNGYFACWAGLLASGGFLHQEMEGFRGRWAQLKGAFRGKEAGRRFLLLAASFVCMWEASATCSKKAPVPCQQELGWAVACPTISLAAMLAFYVPQAAALLRQHAKPVAYVLAVWWIAGVSVMTYKGPFLATGNGFFSAWAATYAAVAMAMDEFQGLNEENAYDTMDEGPAHVPGDTGVSQV